MAFNKQLVTFISDGSIYLQQTNRDQNTTDLNENITFNDTNVYPHPEAQSNKITDLEKLKTSDINNDANFSHPQPKYVLGVSTGHSGSTSAHEELKKANCPWPVIAGFERTVGNKMQYYNQTNPCEFTRNVILPLLDRTRKKTRTWVDLGHFHNQNRILGCVASIAGRNVAFVGIRRNRYHIASSFSQRRAVTPCKKAENVNRRPSVATCPHSDEQKHYGPVNLPVKNDSIWMKFNKFQKFLWYADEMNHRYYTLQRDFPSTFSNTTATGTGNHTTLLGPRYVEFTWSTGEQIKAGVNHMLSELGCTKGGAGSHNNNSDTITHTKNHVHHKERSRNCSQQIIWDLEYRTLMGYTKEQNKILFESHPQHVDDPERMDTKEDLIRAIHSSKASLDKYENIENWILPVE